MPGRENQRIRREQPFHIQGNHKELGVLIIACELKIAGKPNCFHAKQMKNVYATLYLKWPPTAMGPTPRQKAPEPRR
jgi:hypothetical protein